MDITVKGLKHPHRYVLDAAQTHIYMLMKKVGAWPRPGRGQGAVPFLAPGRFSRYGEGADDRRVWLWGWSKAELPMELG